MLFRNVNKENISSKSVKRSFRSAALAIFLPVVLAGCGTTSYLADISYMRDYHVEPVDAPDPSLDGPYSYRTYFYGSGDDNIARNTAKASISRPSLWTQIRSWIT